MDDLTEQPPANPETTFTRKVGRVLWLTILKYNETDGEQRAASFAYYAFFALFPFIILFISIGTYFIPHPDAVKTVILEFISKYLPVDSDDQNLVTNTIQGVIKHSLLRNGAAVIGLAWSSLRFFQALVRGINRAWGTHEYSWWRLPIKNLAMAGILASALLVGIVAPAITDGIAAYWRRHAIIYDFGLVATAFNRLRLFLPILVLFYGLSMFYKFAPRRRTSLSEVWVAALVVALSLKALQRLFILYTTNFSHFNAVYGTLGGVVALLMWIYLSGSLIILGGCLCAAQSEVWAKKPEPPANPDISPLGQKSSEVPRINR
jgi:YihY family inner membrane protein